MSYDVAQLRELEFPITNEYAYFLNCGIAPTPRRSARAAQQFVEDTMNYGVLGEETWRSTIDRVRKKLGRLINVDPATLALVKNTSEGLTIVAQAVQWQPGDVILVPEGEFPAMIYPWQVLESAGVKVEIVPVLDERITPELFEPYFAQGNVRMLALSWVQYHTGWRADLTALGERCRAAGALFCVDVMQGLGGLPLDVGALPIDFCVWGGNKWLLSVQGSGGLYVHPDVLPTLRPANVGWLSVEWESFEHLDPQQPIKQDASRYEEGTRSLICFVALEQSLDLLFELDPVRIGEHILSITDHLTIGLEHLGARIRSDRSKHHWSGIVTWYPSHGELGAYANYFKQHNVLLSVRDGSLRAAPHCYNNLEDVERLLEVYQAALREVR